MMTNPTTSWPVEYLGIPYLPGGQDRLGADCWGFFRLVMAERFKVEIPAVGILPSELRALLDAYKNHPMRHDWREIPLAMAGEGDGLLFAHRPGWPDHVGLALTHGRVLHCVRGIGSAIEPVERLLSRGWREATAWRRG